jgi:hypothetical protein
MNKAGKERLVKSFRSWGKRLLGLAVKGAEKYGILCSSTRFSNDTKG